MSTNRDAVYRAIDSERDYQQGLWPGHEDQDNPLTIGEFLTLLRVYLQKAEEEWTVEAKPEMNALNTVRKVAGIAVNCMEQHGAPYRVVPVQRTASVDPGVGGG